MKRILVFFAIIFFAFLHLNAIVTMPAIFSNNMVLQRETHVSVWGKAAPNEKIIVFGSWSNNGKVKTVADSIGNWRVQINTPKAGGPYKLTVSGKNKIEFNNILIGEVWLCSGQSNMEFRLKGSTSQPNLGSTETILKGNRPDIRLFTVGRAANVIPQYNCKGSWLEANPSTVAEFSAVAYYFGSLINETIGVPIGLISTSYGGSMVECWMSRDLLQLYPNVKLPATDEQIKNPPGTSTVLYNSMLKPVTGFGIRGALWYQGESNRNNPDDYAKLFPAMVNEWRKAWGIGEFPFYYAQIAPNGYLFKGQRGVTSARIREVQFECTKVIPNSGMAILIDVGERDCIHPANKKVVGERLAYWALVKQYGFKGIECQSPEFNKLEVKDNVAKISFANAPNGLTSFGKEITGFELAGIDGIFYPAHAKLNLPTAQIECVAAEVSNPTYVRYAYQDWVIGTLYSTSGLPVSSFRTDKLPVYTE